MIDIGSPIQIGGIDKIKTIMRQKMQNRTTMKEKDMSIQWESVPSFGYFSCDLQVGDDLIRKARILVAKKGLKTIIGI